MACERDERWTKVEYKTKKDYFGDVCILHTCMKIMHDFYLHTKDKPTTTPTPVGLEKQMKSIQDVLESEDFKALVNDAAKYIEDNDAEIDLSYRYKFYKSIFKGNLMSVFVMLCGKMGFYSGEKIETPFHT